VKIKSIKKTNVKGIGNHTFKLENMKIKKMISDIFN